ncbi:hypothetical protein H696_00129 [Fonticula alba]|uniref:TATA-binding protein-associated factor n=1 Tax=Fonticula alba TaxID=691883 RepID=A0A058ZGD0_FONAL|nr:hypothetical protein H696_00129 [Fonticula alba]KCV72537.1 hypothetical protein H696_00129 [Fonticula alba]|eukprot:XP_009492238.1 hypothetical protein H696_00129 [Fonticula alba]
MPVLLARGCSVVRPETAAAPAPVTGLTAPAMSDWECVLAGTDLPEDRVPVLLHDLLALWRGLLHSPIDRLFDPALFLQCRRLAAGGGTGAGTTVVLAAESDSDSDSDSEVVATSRKRGRKGAASSSRSKRAKKAAPTPTIIVDRLTDEILRAADPSRGDIGGQDAATVILARRIQATVAFSQCLAYLPADDTPGAVPSSSDSGIISALPLTSTMVSWLVWDYSTHSALSQELACIIASEWRAPALATLASLLARQLSATDNKTLSYYFEELTGSCARVRAECAGLLDALVRHGAPVAAVPTLPRSAAGAAQTSAAAASGSMDVFTLDLARGLISEHTYTQLLGLVPPRRTERESQLVREELDGRRRMVDAVINLYLESTSGLEETVRGLTAATCVSLLVAPGRVTAAVRPLVDACKREQSALLQRRSAVATAALIRVLVERAEQQAGPGGGPASDDDRSPAARILRSLTLGRAQVTDQERVAARERSRISTLRRGTRAVFRALVAQMFGPSLFRRLPWLWRTLQGPLAERFASTAAIGEEAAANPPADGEFFRALCRQADRPLNTLDLPVLAAEQAEDASRDDTALLTAIGLRSSFVRTQAAAALAAYCSACPVRGVPLLVRRVTPLLADSRVPAHRQGAAEAVRLVVQRLDLAVLPYAVLLLRPVMARMSDPDADTRAVCAAAFADLLRMLPLEGSLFGGLGPGSAAAPAAGPATTTPGLDAGLAAQLLNDRTFLAQLLDPSTIEPFLLPAGAIRAELRPYQQDGLNWLGFLKRYGLGGVLCDDMGLGKTLQTICILAGAHAEAVAAGGTAALRRSLVICPSSVLGHWEQEIAQYARDLRPVVYSGTAAERRGILGAGLLTPRTAAEAVVLIVSYDVFRNDAPQLAAAMGPLLYCVLDEGHMIKNARSRLYTVIRQYGRATAEHRLILSGTPVQNHVGELWALFDFLMPGFLGTERQFRERYGRAIAAAAAAGAAGTAAGEAAARALNRLHRQLLPFLMRRMKADVLHDLPPKTIQDVTCDMSPLQRAIYSACLAAIGGRDALASALAVVDEAGSGAGGAGAAAGGGGGGGSDAGPAGRQHVFQALHQMRKILGHPLLALDPPAGAPAAQCAAARQAERQLLEPLGLQVPRQADGSVLPGDSLRIGPKLLALRDLLLQCGIGTATTSAGGDPDGDASVSSPSDALTASEDSSATVGEIVSNHRALVFCQLTSMIDIIERDVLKPMGNSVSWLRLDGSVEPLARQRMVTRFNRDPSIDLLLLTTSVGGQGLNLTGADTVIFVEHDWNPHRDLQAMDRAHRLGQTRAVHVYRLLTRNSLEDRIMGLQRFKIAVADSIVGADNKGLATMGTEQLFDMFETSSADAAAALQASGAATAGSDPSNHLVDALTLGGGGAAAAEAGSPAALAMANLWDSTANQYGDEYDVAGFVRSLHGPSSLSVTGDEGEDEPVDM